MKKILVLIWSDLYVRNYLDSGALQQLLRDHEVHFAVRDTVTLSAEAVQRLDRVCRYPQSERHEEVGQQIFDVLMLRYAAKSQSFEYRTRVVVPSLLLSLRLGWGLKKAVRTYIRRLWLMFLSTSPIFPLFKHLVVDRLEENRHLAKEIERVQPDLVVFPSSGQHMDAIEVAKICRTRQIPSLCLIDNWDNLSSKSILWERPDHITVWGDQSKEHAVDIQGFQPSDVTVIGTPRFDSYLSARAKVLPSHFTFPYALFVGTALPFDEATALKVLDQEIERHPDVYQGLKIVYRPHPWRLGKDAVLGMNLKHVVVDPQMAENYSKQKLTKAFQPSLDYYPALLNNAAFALGGISSMLIESIVFAKKYLIIAYDETRNVHSPKDIYDYHVHFRGLERIPGLTFCNEFESLPPLFRAVHARMREATDLATIDREREYFLHLEETPYATRLAGLVDRLLQRGHSGG